MAPAPSSHLPAILLLLFLAVTAAHASIYRTTITTTEEEIADPTPAATSVISKKCEEIMQQHPITTCRPFLKYGGHGGSPQWSAPQECCEQLRRVPDSCRCEALKMMTGEMMREEQREMGECRGKCAELMMRGAFLPAMCAAGPPCRFSYGRAGDSLH